jgi:carbamoyltransferase
MGLAPYGKPQYTEELKNHFISIQEDGSISLHLKNYDFEVGLKMLSKKGLSHLQLPVNADENNIKQYYKDIAASVQQITEEIVSKTIKHAIEITGCKTIVLAGGVALNCKANGELLQENIVDNLWIQPAAGDAGGAIGAAQIAYYHYQNNPRNIIENSPLEHVYLGPNYTNDEIKSELLKYYLKYELLAADDLSIRVAKLLNEKNIIGWFQGRSEFGPRALGNRSILASPLFEDMKKHLNLSIKKREGFRPFAPVAMEDKAHDWFLMGGPSKYMLATFKSDKKKLIPSCIHEDNTARVQTVSKEDNAKLYHLIEAFEKESKCPILINTSFNVRGEPIVNSPLDAIRCFFQTEMDVLVLGNYLILKSQNLNVSPVLLKPNEIELD